MKLLNPFDIVLQFLTQPFFIFSILILILISLFKLKFVKGIVGEFQVNILAKFFLDKNIYHLIKGITIPTEDGGTTQIDHVIVSPYGIFVIETKNMKGWIFGSASQKMWTQQIYKCKNQFQNPLHQNYKHTKCLESLLNINASKFFSIVVFIGDSTFKTEMPENVVYAGEYIKYIKRKNIKLLSDFEVKTICQNIASAKLKPSITTHINHVKHVKEIIDKKQNNHNDRINQDIANKHVQEIVKKATVAINHENISNK
ncbi:MAG: hypothetical protein RLZZ210_1293 [Pseudomonadota bacterium]|jgi:hypothetical protein